MGERKTKVRREAAAAPLALGATLAWAIWAVCLWVSAPAGSSGREIGGWWAAFLVAVPLASVALLCLHHWRSSGRLWREIAEYRAEAAERDQKLEEHRTAEEALRRREARYRSAVTNLPVALFTVDAGGVFTLSEGRGLEVLRLAPEEVVGRSIFEIYPDNPQIAENVRHALAGHTLNARVSVDGRTFETWYSHLKENGAFAGVLGVAVDVTERLRAEEALRESERLFATLLANAPAYLYRCRNEPDWPNEFVSDYARELTGYTPQELTDGSVMFGGLIVEEDREPVWRDVQAALAGRRRFSLRYAIRRKDGEIRHVEERGQGVYGADGGAVAIEGVVYDVTEREEAERRLREAEARYRTLVEQIPAVTYMDRADDSFESLYTSPQIEEMLGYTPHEWKANKLWERRLHPDDRERILAADDRLEVEGEPFSEEYRLLARDGGVVWVREEAVLVRDEDGEPLYWQGVIFDVTERKEAEERLRGSEAELRALFAAMTDLIFEIDWEGRYLKVAPTNPSLLYRPPDELLGKTLHEVMPPEEADMFRDHIRQALRLRRKVDTEYSLRIGDEEVWFAGTISPIAEDRVLFVARDITGRKAADEALRKSEAMLANAQRIAHVGSWEWDPRTGDLFWSDEVFRIYGFAPQEFVPTFERLLESVHPEDRDPLKEALDASLHRGEPYDLEHRIVRPDGEERVVHRRAEVVRDEAGEPVRMVGTVHDLTERKALERRLQHQALHDPLTGLPNRVLFAERLRHALGRAKRRGNEVAVLYIDLDNFKVINDSLGHKIGDQLLVVASERIRAMVRPGDTVARLGGDEFVFALEGSGVEDARLIAERISAELRSPFSIGGRRIFVTASVGIAVGGVSDGTDGAARVRAADLLRTADLAMYRAKHGGKARYAVFEEEMNARAFERLELEHDLRQAIEREGFVVHYQPKVALRTGELVGFEALVRWQHPTRGLLLPDEFVPLAEETGLIIPIGHSVLREACRQAEEWQGLRDTGGSCRIFVNLSARQFNDPELVGTVSRVLEETALNPRWLTLEITESTAMDNATATAAALEELHRLGVGVAIDDFGTGYSSLSYLQRFPVDYVKVDRSFVSGLGGDPEASVLVKGMIDLAHALGLETIAEGVETAEQLELLRAMGCDVGQGYYFSEPLPAKAADTLLENGTLC